MRGGNADRRVLVSPCRERLGIAKITLSPRQVATGRSQSSLGHGRQGGMLPSPEEKQHSGGRWQRCWRKVRKTAGSSGQLEVDKTDSHTHGRSLEFNF